ncbi:MAG: glycosyl hydrolase-related protein [Chloroflexota bacterium]|nr:glycosyl hydrolase-related protein [Chloroflexota bacterium]
MLVGVVSTRIWLKQRYAHCEDLLARYAEPLAGWAHIARKSKGASEEQTLSDKGLLRQAWKLLLQNGPHDSVTGCSVDAVYDDVSLRFEKCEQIAESVLFDSHGLIAGLAAPTGVETVTVFNPEHGPRVDFASFRLPVRDGRLPSHVVDEAGHGAPLQITERGLHSPRDNRERVEAAFVAPDVPGFGYKAFRVEYDGTASAAKPEGASIENELFRVTGEAEGTLTVEDKRTGGVPGGTGEWPREKSLISIPIAEVVLSSLKLGADDHGIVVRVYNIANDATAANLTLREPYSDVHEVDMNEENEHPAVAQGGAVRLGLSPNQIVTLLFGEK